MNLTDTEIDLCRELEGLWEHKTKAGDWFYYTDKHKIVLACWSKGTMDSDEDRVWIPRIEDLLEILRERGYSVTIRTRDDEWARKSGWEWQVIYEGDGLLGGTSNARKLTEALLWATIAVLSEERDE